MQLTLLALFMTVPPPKEFEVFPIKIHAIIKKLRREHQEFLSNKKFIIRLN